MKQYILKNFEPVLLGITIGLLIMIFKDLSESIITKIAILINK